MLDNKWQEVGAADHSLWFYEEQFELYIFELYILGTESISGNRGDFHTYIQRAVWGLGLGFRVTVQNVQLRQGRSETFGFEG